MPGSIASLSIACAIAAAGAVAARPAAPAGRAQQPPVAPPAAGPAAPTRDPVTVRGCLEGRWLRILQHDSSDLSGIRRVRLKGSRSMLTVLKDQGGDYVEVSGDLDLGRRDRLDGRRKVKVADKTTISIGASAEQISGPDDVTPPEATLVVDSFTALGERCPKNL
jgi:hypothetical protein